MAKVIVRAEPEFKILYNLPPDTYLVIIAGGRGGKKTYEVSKFIAFSAAMRRKRCVILRDEKTRIRQTILNEIWDRYDSANKHGHFNGIYDRLDTELKEISTGKSLIYPMGFRTSSNDKRAALKGPSDIDIAVFEEFEDFRDEEKYNTFVDGLRKAGSVTLLLFNVPDIGHFVIKRNFNLEHVLDEKGEPTGYYKIIPKDLPGVVFIFTTFEDNPYLPPHVINKYKAYGDPNAPAYNYHYYMTQIKGYASTGRKGQVFTKVKPIKLDDYMKLPFVEIYGQDFGTASPAATVGVKFDGNKAYIRLLNYKPLPALEIGKMYSRLKFTQADKIVCDYAEPSTISKLANGWKDLDPDMYVKYPELASGFYAVPCTSKDIEARIGLMTGMELYAVEEHQELWDEIHNFVYAQDKWGNYTNTPIDDWNHAFFDAAGYVIVDQRGYTMQKAF